ncbi:molecular chaperone [Pseudoalteromonas sp. NBT06-2]|uniref:molecular chaperone n=1 Tax=Pseudoalteromonas sp. NBT06-2 TaxID=2025950 RepID=UPI000BA7A169|nr:molecular chaperone [Pseudoalteromonas sp. NBT06-2]PAJ72777.1 molecular chaperone [Pseudoalteromonas sp. NBT06-2]
MFAGFDYGSSNCAIGVWQQNQINLVPLEGDNYYIPSTLYALHPSLIVSEVYKGIKSTELKHDYQKTRQPLLNSLTMVKSNLDLTDDECKIHLGRDAITEYIECPEEGHFVKSPKSFFGAIGLKKQQLDFFEDIACAMIMTLKQRAESHLGAELKHTVIGRPVNFQAIGGEKSNQQALTILHNAAMRAGFSGVEFLFEPLAAGIDFESKLDEDKIVLVVDIGGGTTDCSLVKMGPSYRDKNDRQSDFLAHTGKRVGGNDLDINLAYHGLMPLFGSNSKLKSGIPMPNQPFWHACKINDVILQSEFYSAKNQRALSDFILEVDEPNKFKRLLSLQENKQGHQLVRTAELAKIALSGKNEHLADLGFIESQLSKNIVQQELASAIDSSITQVVSLALDAIKQGGCKPDVMYLTGGSAQSPLIKAALTHALGDIPMLNGDHFGSVTAGLTKWAKKIFS